MKSILLLLTVFVGSLFLTACTGSSPNDKQPNNIALEQNKKSDNNLLGDSTQNNSSPSSQAEKNLTLDLLKQGDKMKKLEDFEQIAATQVTLSTTKGDITFELYRDQAPITTANFLTLAKSGFYDEVVFHRVIEDFMAQVGDPLSKDPNKKAMWGTGGPGYTIPDEFVVDLKHDSAGIVSMANSGPNTGGSQFFITYGPTPWLDGKHAIFGKVTAGMDVLEKITVGDKINAVSYE